MLFLDFHKAFDSIEHSFIRNIFKHFGFGNAFLDMIAMLHTDIIIVVFPSQEAHVPGSGLKEASGRVAAFHLSYSL